MNNDAFIDSLKSAFPDVEVTREQIEFALLATCPKSPDILSIETGFLINHLDFDLLSSFHPLVFRNLLPVLLYGLAFCLRERDNPIVFSVFQDLINYPNVAYWDDKFIEKWADMTGEQYDLIEVSLNRCGPELEELNLGRAHSTLSALRQLSS